MRYIHSSFPVILRKRSGGRALFSQVRTTRPLVKNKEVDSFRPLELSRLAVTAYISRACAELCMWKVCFACREVVKTRCQLN